MEDLTDSRRSLPSSGIEGGNDKPILVLDCYGLLCPVPIRKTVDALVGLNAGEILEVIATDDWFGPDLEAWLRYHPHELLKIEQIGQETHAYLRKVV